MTYYLKRKNKKTGEIIVCCDYSTKEIAEHAKALYEKAEPKKSLYEFFISTEF